MHRWLFACLLLTLTLGQPRAAQIALYSDPAWVDSGSASASADSLGALLSSLGHTYTTFSGRAGAGFSTALTGADLVLFPELLNYGQLVGVLEPGAITALRDFVSGGGGLIAAGDFAIRMLDAVFFPGCGINAVQCFASSGTSGPSVRDAGVAAGTPYAAGPATLTSPPSPLEAINSYAFFPAGGLNLYRDLYNGVPNGTTALTAKFGLGKYGYLAWGFAGSAPNGTLDGGWNALLGIMANDVAAAPEPPAALLLLGAVPLLAARRRLALGLGHGDRRA
jgi:hypothetical protein